MARIKITGYIDTDNLSAMDVDLDDPTGLSAEGHLRLIVGHYGNPLEVTDLEDVETEVVSAG